MNCIKYSIILILLLVSISAQKHGFVSTDKKNVLFLNSDPLGIEVFIGDSLYGKTPVEVMNLPTGIYNIIFKQDTSELKKYNVNYEKGKFREVFGIMNEDYSLLTVYTNPASADVSINDSLIGKTPLKKHILKSGVYDLRVSHTDYLDWKQRLLAKADLYTFDKKLLDRYGYVSVSRTDLNATLNIDGKEITNTTPDQLKFDIGEHEISFSGKSIHLDYKSNLDINSGKNYNVQFHYGYYTPIPLIQSLFLPGLGQFIDGAILKGTLLFSTTALLGVLTNTLISKYNSKVDLYENNKKIYENTVNEFDVITYRSLMTSSHDDTQVAKKNVMYSVGALMAVYLYNVIDAIFNHSIGGEITIHENYSSDLKSKLSIQIPIN